jgi:hypothetical protein
MSAGCGDASICAPHASIGECAVGLDRERGEARRERLGDDQRAVIGDHRAVREPEVLGSDDGSAVWIDAHDGGRRRVAAGQPAQPRRLGLDLEDQLLASVGVVGEQP